MCLRAENVLFSMYPSYVFSLIMGFAPYKIQTKGAIVKIEYMKIYQVVSILLYAVFIFSLAIANYSAFGYYLLQTPMERFINFLYFVLVVGLLSVNVIFNKVHTKSMITLWEKIYHIDSLIKNRGIKLSYKKLMIRTLVYCCAGSTMHTAYIAFMVSIQHYKDSLYSGSVYFALNFSMQGFICTSCSFYALFSTIGHMFEKILDHMENCLLRSPQLDLESRLNSITYTSTLHQELCAVARLANHVTSVQMLASFAATFGMATLQIYSIVTAFNIRKFDYNFVVSSLVCVTILLKMKITLSLVSHRCMGMIPRTKELLTKVINLYIDDYKLTREANAFNLQILHDQFDITASNFFVIEPAIFLTAGSAITAYIMLFIQTDPFVDLYQSMKVAVGAI